MVFEGRIQNLLIKPEISKILNSTASSTNRDMNSQLIEKEVAGASLDVELTREIQKKERLQKLREANQIEEQKHEKDKHYQEAMRKLRKTAK